MSKVIRFKVDKANGIENDIQQALRKFWDINEVDVKAKEYNDKILIEVTCNEQQAFNLGVIIGKIVMSYNVEYVSGLVSHSCKTAINSLTSEDYTNPNDVMSRITNDLLGSWK